ncbi:caspase family protein [Actinophytocola sp.]|uniref:nSTAND1 domain-containing NTPase n=1 Tax=Actinophytocola sp. TaxID=1872138 RepID=UPI002ED27A30
MHDDTTRPRRYLIATAIAHYPNAPHWDRPGLAAARDQVVSLFTQDLGYVHVSDLGLNPTRGQLTKLLRDFSRDPARRPDDLVAVYIGGHGEVLESTGDHVLLTADTDPDDIEDALPTAELARKMLLGTRVRRVLLMLDTCYSGRGGNELTAAAVTSMTTGWGDDDGAGLVVITSAQPAEQAQAGAFPRLLRDAVHSLPTAGYNPDTLPLDSVVKAMNAHAAKPGYQTVGFSVAGLAGEIPPFLPNPRHDPGMTEVDLAIQHASEWEIQAERRDIEFRTRLLVRAMGGTSHTAQDGWWFAGRHTALLDITAWLHHSTLTRPLLAVTGDPGSGKTAVLGLIATLTHPDRRRTVPLHTLGLPAAAVPRSGAVDVAIYAQSLTTEQVLAGIAAAAHLHATTPGQLLEQLAGRDAPLTVLIDALDEATDPDHLTRQLLHPLAQHADGRLRLLVGTRPYLLDRLGLRRESEIDLDADRYADLDALTTYTIRGLLEAHPHSPYPHQPPALIRAVADAVAAAAQPSFLVARIISATLAAQDHIADPRDPAWRATLPSYPGDAMRRDLETRLGDNATKVRDLLRPLAFAEGQGLPWEDIWAAVASHAAHTTYTDDDLLWLRRHAGSYVVEATEAGRSTYRLYHQALADHLRNGVEPASMHRAITDVLHNRVPRALEGRRDWTRAHPYTLRHLATHAQHADQLNTLITDTDYLVHADPDTLLPALHRTTTDDGDLIAAIYAVLRGASHQARAIPTSRRARLLALTAAHFGLTDLQQRFNAIDDSRYQIEWAHDLGQPHQRIPIDDSVRTMALGRLGKHGFVIVCGTDDFLADHVIRVYDTTGQPVLPPLTGHTDWVSAVAIGRLHDPANVQLDHVGNHADVIVSASADHSVRIWDATGQQVGQPLTGHMNTVLAVAIGRLNNQDRIVSGDRDGTIWMWDAAGQQIGQPLTGHTGPVTAIAIGRLDSRDVIVSGGQDGCVRIWDTKGQQIDQLKTGDRVNAVAIGRLGSRDVIVSGGDAGTVQVWNNDGRLASTPLVVHTGEEQGALDHTGFVFVSAVTVAHHPDYGGIVVSAHGDATVRVWNSDLEPIDRPLIGHNSRIQAVAAGRFGERFVIASAGDSKVLIWDSPRLTYGQSQAGHAGGINGVAAGQLGHHGTIIVSAGVNNTLRIWDTTGRPIGQPLTGHTRFVDSVAVGHLRHHGDVIISGGGDGTVWVWDADQHPIGRPLDCRATDIHAVSVSYTGDRVIALSTDFRNAKVWTWHPNEQPVSKRLKNYHGLVTAAAIGRIDNRDVVVCGDDNGAVRIWDTKGHLTQHFPTGTTHTITAVAIGHLSACGDIIATASNSGTVRLWDAHGQAIEQSIVGHTGSVYALATGCLGDRNVIISGGRDDSTVRVWDICMSRPVEIVDLLTPVYAVALLTNNSICIAADNTLCYWTGKDTFSKG